MDFEQLLSQEPKEITYWLSALPLLNNDDLWGFTEALEEQVKREGRISHHIFYEWAMDHRRGYRLSAIKFDGAWIAVFQQAGRSLEDHSRAFVLNKAGFFEAQQYVTQLLTPAPSELDTRAVLVDLTDNCDDIFKFYGEDVRVPNRCGW